MSSVDSADILALIPARGGSKGIPHKNIQPVLGRPLIGYTIEDALETVEIDRVLVSTDDSKIARVSMDEGAEVLERPTEISGDTASSESALNHALSELKKQEGYEPDLVVFLQATSPIRQPGDISGAIRQLAQRSADSLFSACRQHGFLWHRDAGTLHAVDYDPDVRPRRQETPEKWVENGSIYVFQPWVLSETGSRLGGTIAIYPMHELDSYQVDRPEDLELVEQLLRLRHNRSAEPDSLRTVELLVLDFDGVLTDDTVLVDEEGREAVVVHRGDGHGISLLRERGVEVMILSRETNPVVQARANKLGLKAARGCTEKLVQLRKWADERALTPKEIAYVGNDVSDIECMRWVGHPFAVRNAKEEVKSVADIVTDRSGGCGAVREVCELIWTAKEGGA